MLWPKALDTRVKFNIIAYQILSIYINVYILEYDIDESECRLQVTSSANLILWQQMHHIFQNMMLNQGL